MDSNSTGSEQYGLDPTDFDVDKIDDSVHDTLDPVNCEWWYFDATFDNNYSVASIWWDLSRSKTAKERFIDFSVYDPTGKKIMVKRPFDNKAVSISTEKCDVKMRDNHVYGEVPEYRLHFLDDGLGADLVFENLVQGYRTPPDGTAYFSMNPMIYMGWTIAQPRASVRGKLIIDGKEIDVTGTGYHDHNWCNKRFNELYDHWYWGRIFLPGHTFIYSVGVMGEYMEHAPICALMSFEGNKLVDMTNEITDEPSDFVMDHETGIEYPRKLVLKIDSEVVKGEVTHTLKNLIESYPLADGYPFAENEKTTYGHGAVRFFSDCKVDLVVNGRNVRHKTELIHELMKP
jgi:hypothetical protein